MAVRQTHTYVTLEVPATAYDFIAKALSDAGYNHQLSKERDGALDMQGIALTRRPDPAEPDWQMKMWAERGRCQATTKDGGQCNNTSACRIHRSKEDASGQA